MEIVCLDQLLASDHPYRKFYGVVDFKSALSGLENFSNIGNVGADGFSIIQLFMALLLQFMEDNSDREHERFMRENTAARWFCGFKLNDKTTDQSTLCRSRQKIGTKKLSVIFENIRQQLKSIGLISEVFTFVDATHLISKANLWQERDKAIGKKIEKLNNETLPKVAVDKQAKIGCKGKNKYWYGYKQHTSVDMQSGYKVAVSPANETDAEGLKRICPTQGAVYGDKGYCIAPARQTIKARGCHDATIKKNNMKAKNKDLDKWLTKIRAPYERIFSQLNHRLRYRGVSKNQFWSFMNAISFNIKRLVVLQA